MNVVPKAFLPKDFLETAEGLCFAVVQGGTELADGQDVVLCFLRYLKAEDDNYKKVGTEVANEYLKSHYPSYLHHSTVLDADLHAVPVNRVHTHHQPRQRLQAVLQKPTDKVEEEVMALCDLFAENGLDLTQVGITGSVLIGAQNPASDIDLVIYDRDLFHQARKITENLIQKGQLTNLNDADWLEAYFRRSCELTLDEYVWHERRKFIKAMFRGRKFDLNFINTQVIEKQNNYKKLGKIHLITTIVEDSYGFDYPAVFGIEHETIKHIVCFIATYTGQAVVGEMVEIAGLLEQSEQGDKRIVVGSSREAPGEYIKVIQG